MKKLFALLLALVMVLSLAACGGKDDKKAPSHTDRTETSKPSTSQQTPSSKPDENKPAESEQSTDSQPSDEELVKKANEIAATFGSYNGNALVWNVLTVDTENEKALLLTEKCIDIIPFHESDSAFTWESSEIRAWLGGEFYDNTFSDAEKALVIETINNNPANSETGIAGCDDTTDRVFLLSEKEALEYFETDDERLAETYDGDIFQWWLRTPGESESWFMLINDSGGLYYAGSTSNSSYGVRPAVWIDLSDGDPLAQRANTIAASFGTYNGSPISWRVLDVDAENERALLITKDCLTEAQFHAETPEDLTWRTSDLRVWLIGDFHFSSFTDEEKGMILEVENPQDTNSETGAREPDGYETTDTVFILSASEMTQYFADDEDMAGFIGDEGFSYWTRTPGNDTTGYVCTYSGGGLYMTGNSADSTGVAVRPAIWVDLSGEWAESATGETGVTPTSSAGGQDGFAMPTLNSYDTFPPADYWTALGLPADFTIEISEMEFSSKNSIYPLNAKDGNMFTCVVSDNVAAYTALTDSLWNAGIKGVSADGTNITEAADRGEVDDYDIDEHIYKAYWLNNGELMDIYIRTRDGSNKISITVRYAPEIDEEDNL